MTLKEVQEYLVDEAEYSEESVYQMTPYELVDAWLQWNGIIGYTDDIIDLVQATHKPEDEDEY